MARAELGMVVRNFIEAEVSSGPGPCVGFQASSRHVHFNSSTMSLSGIRAVCLCLFVSLLSPSLN